MVLVRDAKQQSRHRGVINPSTLPSPPPPSSSFLLAVVPTLPARRARVVKVDASSFHFLRPNTLKLAHHIQDSIIARMNVLAFAIMSRISASTSRGLLYLSPFSLPAIMRRSWALARGIMLK